MARFALRKATWTAKHNKILVGTFQGLSTITIARSCNVSQGTVNNIRKSEEFKAKIAAMNNESQSRAIAISVEKSVTNRAREVLEKAQYSAAKKVTRLMRRGVAKDRLQFEAAKDILDRTGLKAIEVIETRERQYTHEEVERAKNTLTEVETIMTRLQNKDSSFLLARQTRTTQPLPSSSVTDQGSDAPIIQEAQTDPT